MGEEDREDMMEEKQCVRCGRAGHDSDECPWKEKSWPEDTSDYGSRIAVIGQNGNDGLHYAGGREAGEGSS